MTQSSTAPKSKGGVDADILAGILHASSDACWCMEFGEPVDLTAPDHEIVRQVFENDPHWTFTNPAMARLYLLDPKIDFSSRPISEIFPRNRQNEDFILRLIANGFEVDAAPALDTRYDGVEIYVENDVRANITDGLLLRMFGIVRDVGKHRLREQRLRTELDRALDTLNALPSAIVAFDADGRVTLVNAAASRLLRRDADDLGGSGLADLGLPKDAEAAVAAVLRSGPPVSIASEDLLVSVSSGSEGGAVASLVPHPERFS